MVRSSRGGSTVSFRVHVPLMDHLAGRGVDVAAFLSHLGLPVDLCERPDARVRPAERDAIWQYALEITRDSLLPARIAKEVHPKTIGVMTYLAKAASDGVDAVQRVRNFLALMHDGADLELEFQGELAVLHVRLKEPDTPILPTSEYSAALFVFIGRFLSGGTREAFEVRVPHPAPPHAAAFEAFIGVPVRYGAASIAAAFPREQFTRPLPGADEGLSELLESYAREMLSRIPVATSFVERVRAAAQPRLPHGSPGIEDIAAELRMSARTVRRRLKEEGATYRSTLDDLRCELAVRALQSGDESIDRIAQDLGFSDTSAFHKAFRRWTGQSPAHFYPKR